MASEIKVLIRNHIEIDLITKDCHSPLTTQT